MRNLVDFMCYFFSLVPDRSCKLALLKEAKFVHIGDLTLFLNHF